MAWPDRTLLHPPNVHVETQLCWCMFVLEGLKLLNLVLAILWPLVLGNACDHGGPGLFLLRSAGLQVSECSNAGNGSLFGAPWANLMRWFFWSIFGLSGMMETMG